MGDVYFYMTIAPEWFAYLGILELSYPFDILKTCG